MNTKQDNIIRTDYAEIMQKSYIDYAMSVIITICMSWVSVTTARTVNVPVS